MPRAPNDRVGIRSLAIGLFGDCLSAIGLNLRQRVEGWRGENDKIVLHAVARVRRALGMSIAHFRIRSTRDVG